jgi:HD-GYP domain-containing protein (c-di-GMP phosphodiesterase class II)
MYASSATDFDPVAERLLEEGRERKLHLLLGSERITRWLFALGFLAAAVPLALLAPSSRTASPAIFALLVGSFAIASRIEFEVGSGGTLPTELVLVPMLFVLPAGSVPLAVAAALLLGQLPEYLRGRFPVARVPVVVGNAWYSLGPALVIIAFGEPGPSGAACGVLVLALAAQYATDFGSSVAREWFALRIPPRQLVRPLLWVFMIDTLLAPVGLAAALGSRVTAAAVFLPLPLLGLIWIFARERTQRLDQTLELSNAYRGTAFLLGDVVEADDAYTGAHSREVVELVLAVCDELRIDPRSRRKAEFAALLHDVGKIRIPGEIINKPGPLTDAERRIINTHTIEGEQLLLRVGGLLAEVGTIVRSCHENYDGSGYPDGLAGEQIPLAARIVSACDAYDAITSDRPYRKGRSPQAALAELAAARGTQFDPGVVDAITGSVVRELGRSATAEPIGKR